MMTKRKPTAVAYLRVSTDRQADDGAGLDVQADKIRAYCRDHGLRLAAICTDVITGTTPLEARDGLGCVFAHLAAGTASVVVVYRLDRLARDLVLQESLIGEIRRTGGEIATTSPTEAENLTDDPDDPSRKMVRQILGSVAEYERAMIALRMRSGRRRKREQGGYADGAPSYGWNAVGKALVEDPAEQATLARMRELRAAGASLQVIADTLNADGIATKRGTGRWHPATVARCLDVIPASVAAGD
jgi:DNA invertase Pin-like site-specific DNA recombinase